MAATICVAKLFDSNPELMGGQGFFVMLPDMLGGAKPMVVANAVVPLCGISAGARRNYLKLGETTVSKLLPALYEGMEWGAGLHSWCIDHVWSSQQASG